MAHYHQQQHQQPYATPTTDHPPSFVGINIPDLSPGQPPQGYPYSAQQQQRAMSQDAYPMAYSPNPAATSPYAPPATQSTSSYVFSPSLPPHTASHNSFPGPLLTNNSAPAAYTPTRRSGSYAGHEMQHPASPYMHHDVPPSPRHAYSPHHMQQPDHFGAARSTSYSPSHYALGAIPSQAAAAAGPIPSPLHTQQSFYAPAPSPRQAPPRSPSASPAAVSAGFRIVREARDLRPILHPQPAGRRIDPEGNGQTLSPLKALTTHISQTYHIVNPAFRYELAFNPRRVLTKPSKPAGNDGHDNEDSDYILYVNDLLGSEDGNKYRILDVLGQGTFGQVVKCQNIKTHEIVAVKVVKNKPAYFNQSMMEVTILELLNNTWDPDDRHHILRLKDTFIHHSHLCLVFELLASNLYELIKQNSFRGLSTSLVRVFTAQLLDSMAVLNEARLIHCDLKPENILLKTLQSPTIKVIDFGSACHERQTVYTYIQSRFYRSPEVLLGLPYSSAIDMWSLGCICVELFLGLPLFPGTSEYNQLSRIVEMLGPPPTYMIEVGKQAGHFFEPCYDQYGGKTYRIKSLEQYSRERNVQEQPSKKYFQATTLPDIIKTYPTPRKSSKPVDAEKEMTNRIAFIDFVQGLLNMNPMERWTPQQARLHPFILGEALKKPFVPPPISSARPSYPSTTSAPASPATSSHPSPRIDKQPYGGLPTTPQHSSSSRNRQQPYTDAASYNQHLAQQHAYNAAATAYRNQPPPSNNPYAQQPVVVAPPPPAPVHHGQTRRRTIGQMDAVPPQLAKLGFDLSSIPGQSVTPVLRREDQRLAWEARDPNLSSHARRQSVSRHNPGLDLLTEQAERGGWHLSSLPGAPALPPPAMHEFDAFGEPVGMLPYIPLQPTTRSSYYQSPSAGHHPPSMMPASYGGTPVRRTEANGGQPPPDIWSAAGP